MSGTMTTPPNGTDLQHEKPEQGVTDLWDFRPNVGDAETDEPSLRSIVYRYYRAHFDHDQATSFTREYFANFYPAYAAAPDMLAALLKAKMMFEYNGDGRVPLKDQAIETYETICAAIARAEGSKPTASRTEDHQPAARGE